MTEQSSEVSDIDEEGRNIIRWRKRKKKKQRGFRAARNEFVVFMKHDVR